MIGAMKKKHDHQKNVLRPNSPPPSISPKVIPLLWLSGALSKLAVLAVVERRWERVVLPAST